MALLEACLTVLRGRERAVGRGRCLPAGHPGTIPHPGGPGARMRALAAAMTEPRPLADFLPPVPVERRGEPAIVRSALASTFLAALELCRDAVVALAQPEGFAAITVSPPFASGPGSE